MSGGNDWFYVKPASGLWWFVIAWKRKHHAKENG
jgi:hypothetical protein